jgi:pimeloyl-ACP methyl ester carboxylesterase
MKFKKAAPLIAISLAIAGCSTLEKTLLNSDFAKGGVYSVRYRYMNNFGKKSIIEDYGLAEKKDESPEKPIFFFIHGWASCLKEYSYEEKGQSRLDVMKDVFDSRVIMADYSSSRGIDSIFSELEDSFLNFNEEYSKNNSGKKPTFIIAGHSMGTSIERLFTRKYPDYFSKAGIIAGVNDGFSLGILRFPLEKLLPRYIDKLAKRPLNREDYQSINDLMPGSDFLKRLNTATNPLSPEYNFYIFSSQKDSFFIPGKDDHVTSVKSAYPLNLIEKNRFEKVRIGEVVVYEGAVSHSLYNLDLLRNLLESLKSEKPGCQKAPSLKQARHIKVLKFSQQEIDKIEKEKRFKKEIKF